MPHEVAALLQSAAKIELGEIPLLGYGDVNIGLNPDWQRDPFAGLSAPMRHWKTIPYLDPAKVGDHKVVWEISRHQYFVTLGQAWQLTRDERWPRVFVNYLQSWLDNNPPSVGMNWASSLEVSYRAISWVWAMQLMRDSTHVNAALQERVLQSLHAHGTHLERYLSTYFSPNTHLTGEALGLFYIGTQCPELPRAKVWTQLGADALEKALTFQVLPDGVYFEQATQYHRYTIDIYLHYLLLARLAQRNVAPAVESSLHRLFDVLLHLTRGDGTIPLMGDDDGGRLVQLDARLPHDVRALLAMGAVVLQRSDLAWMGRGDDSALYWTLGASAPKMRDSLVTHAPAEHARAFASGGLFTMRDGWDNHDSHSAIDAGPHGALSFGHSHADALSVEIAIGGRALFADVGTYTYVGEHRDAFRTTAAHNTVEIDGTSTSKPSTAFRWATVAHARATGWVNDREFSYFSGTHDGYASLPSPVTHDRGVLRFGAGLWVIADRLSATSAHDAALRWHAVPGLTAISENRGAGFSILRLAQNGVERAVLATFGGENGSMHVERGWVSPQFARKAEASVFAWKEKLAGNAMLASIVMDTAHWDVDLQAVREHQQIRGALGALVLRSRHSTAPKRVVVLSGNGGAMHFGDLTVTADIACVTLDVVSGAVVALNAVGATYAGSSATEFLAESTQKQWLCASRADATEALWQIRSGVIQLPDAPLVAAQLRHSPVLSHA